MLLVGVEHVTYKMVDEPKHDMFYKYGNEKMSFIQ